MTGDLLRLWFTFFYVGMFTIGGGYVMLPFLERELVDKHKWLSHEELIDIFALGQSTPGIIAINVATFVGVKKRGVVGGLVSTLGMVMPSFIIITLIALFWNDISDISVVEKFFSGVRVVVAGLLISAVYKLFRKSINDIVGVLIFLAAFVAIVFIHVSPVFVVITAAVAGICWYTVLGMKNTKGR